MAASFLDEITASMPPGLDLPDEFKRLFAWMEPNGFVHTYRSNQPGRYASLYPASLGEKGGSVVTFRPVDPSDAEAWTQSTDPALTHRLALFIRTGGDGSMAGLWRDDAGQVRFVHLGSGSGSVMMCVLADTPVDMLRLLAIGYVEACWPQDYGLTAAETYDPDVTGEPFTPPLMFQAWVRDTFGVPIPARASEIIKQTASMDDDASDDPFWLWMRALEG